MSVLYFFVHITAGAICEDHLMQPPLLAGPWGQDILMPCQLSPSNETTPGTILYWENLGMDSNHAKLWPPSMNYQARVDRLSKNRNSANMSILLKNVQWADTGSYLCKTSILDPESDKRYRLKGSITLLLIYGKKKTL